MKANELNNLWVGYNKTENFRVLICALDIEEAQEIADGYRFDSRMEGKFEVAEFDNLDTHFNCDYVLMNGY